MKTFPTNLITSLANNEKKTVNKNSQVERVFLIKNLQLQK